MQRISWIQRIGRKIRQMQVMGMKLWAKESYPVEESAETELDVDFTEVCNTNAQNRFESFLAFEVHLFGKEFPIPAYDPYLIRYGEYRFALEMLDPSPGETILDLGCGASIFGLFLAFLGARILAVDVDPKVGKELMARKARAEQCIGSSLDVEFRAEDATHLSLEPGSADKVVAISSIEHMFSDRGPGDQLAIGGIARALKPGGKAIITLPTSNGGPFHEAPSGDARFGGPYRLYTPDALQERILSHPQMETVQIRFLAHTTPAPYKHLCFFQFWMNSLTPNERWKWAWANPFLASVFNPIISYEEGLKRLETVNTALICLQKKGPWE